MTVEDASSVATPQLLYVVSRHDRGLYEYLKQHFADTDVIEVVLDRRRRDESERPGPVAIDGQRVERRARDISAGLQRLGRIVVERATTQPKPTFDRTAPAAGDRSARPPQQPQN